MRTVSLDRIIRDMASILDDPEAERTYTKLLRILVNELQDLKLTSIPDVKSDIFTVTDNNTVNFPPEIIKPIQAGKYISINGTGAVYPLGQRNAGFELAMKPRDGFQCGPDDLEDVGVTFSYQNYNNNNSFDLQYCNYWYGTTYGYSPERVFGYWSFDKEYGRMIFEDGHVSPGDKIIVKFIIDDVNFKTIPVDWMPMLKYKCFQQYFLSSDPRKSNMNFELFKMEFTRFKRNMQQFGYQDYINALNRAYNTGVK
jgi:hypothetical protein